MKRPKGCWWSIDPGTNTGIAVWGDGTFAQAFTIANADPFKRLKMLERHSSPDLVVIEKPAYFASSHVTAAAGDLVTLTIGVGMYAGFFAAAGVPVEFVDVNTWKGQLPKAVTAARVRKRLGREHADTLRNSHVIDAIGIGLWRLENF